MQQILNVKLILPNVVFVLLLHPRLSEAGYLGAHRPSNNSIVFREAPQAPGLTAVAAETDAWEKKRGNKKRAPGTAVAVVNGPQTAASRRAIYSFSATLADTHYKLSFRRGPEVRNEGGIRRATRCPVAGQLCHNQAKPLFGFTPNHLG